MKMIVATALCLFALMPAQALATWSILTFNESSDDIIVATNHANAFSTAPVVRDTLSSSSLNLGIDRISVSANSQMLNPRNSNLNLLGNLQFSPMVSLYSFSSFMLF